MEAEFWEDRWKSNKIAFHEGIPNALMQKHISQFGLREQSRIFVPLCGKAHDLNWLTDQGHVVIGAELSESAVREVFDRTGIAYEVERSAGHTRYHNGRLDIFVGDFFDLTAAQIGSIDAIYDRAALVALPTGMRDTYAERLVQLTSRAPQFLITYDYDQSQTSGPPFSVPEAEVTRLYDGIYKIETLDSMAISGPLAARCSGLEIAWRLSPL
ncbi:MAG: thiopurine S-methyltransferase [Pseudomonadota bacterium]